MEDVLAGCLLDELPAKLIGDKAYDSDPPDEKLATDYGVERISSNRCNRKLMAQGGRHLRRYRRRWKIERIIAWMLHCRRLVARWEHRIENFLGFVPLACLLMLLRHG